MTIFVFCFFYPHHLKWTRLANVLPLQIWVTTCQRGETREKTASVLLVWEMRTLSFATPRRANIMQEPLVHPKTRANTHVDMTCLRLVCLGRRCMCAMAHHSGYVVILLQLGLCLCACSAVIVVPQSLLQCSYMKSALTGIFSNMTVKFTWTQSLTVDVCV